MTIQLLPAKVISFGFSSSNYKLSFFMFKCEISKYTGEQNVFVDSVTEAAKSTIPATASNPINVAPETSNGFVPPAESGLVQTTIVEEMNNSMNINSQGK